MNALTAAYEKEFCMSTALQDNARHSQTSSRRLPLLLDEEHASAESLPSAAVLPEQFYNLIAPPAAGHGVRALMHAVLDNALWYWRKQFTTTNRREQRLAREAGEWIFSEDVSWPFSFVNICEALGLDPAYMRQGIRQWQQRPPARAARAKGHPVFVNRFGKLAA